MKYVIEISKDERSLLQSILHQRSHASRILRRCEMLLKAEQGLTDTAIAADVGCSVNCVANLRKRFAQGGLHRALYDAPRTGAPQKFNEEQLQQITRLAAGKPPAGKKRWTIELICSEAANRGIVDSISVGRVYALIKEHDQPPQDRDGIHDSV